MNSKPKYTSSWKPTKRIARIPNSEAPADDYVSERWQSPYANNKNLLVPGKNGNKQNKKYTVAVVHSEEPLTAAQHNRLLNRLKNVTAI